MTWYSEQFAMGVARKGGKEYGRTMSETGSLVPQKSRKDDLISTKYLTEVKDVDTI